MTDLLSREKEFLKLNERLEQLATTVFEQQKDTKTAPARAIGNVGTTRNYVSSAAAPTPKADQRFCTYTKAKGQTTLLKKRGAGDGYPEPLLDKPKERNVRHPKSKSPRSSQRNESDESSTVHPDSTPRDHSHSKNNNSHRSKNVNTKNSSSRSLARSYTLRSPRSPTFTIKYRNPKFVQSPSLEVLVKEETASLKRSSKEQHTLSSSISGSSTLTSISKKHVSADGIIKFLKSKVAILEEDHERITQEMNNQKELLEKAIERQKKVEQQRDQAYAKNNSLVEQLTKTETQLEDAHKRTKDTVLEQSSTQKELEKAKRELKVLSQTNTNLEKRLYRANEELENAKTALSLVKNVERELKETMRQECESKDNQIKSLKKQRADLLNAYKKQLFLIDNLKKQNMCMEQSKMIVFSEKEFTKVLEWNAKT